MKRHRSYTRFAFDSIAFSVEILSFRFIIVRKRIREGLDGVPTWFEDQ